jgi:hypothetical protein
LAPSEEADAAVGLPVRRSLWPGTRDESAIADALKTLEACLSFKPLDLEVASAELLPAKSQQAELPNTNSSSTAATKASSAKPESPIVAKGKAPMSRLQALALAAAGAPLNLSAVPEEDDSSVISSVETVRFDD